MARYHGNETVNRGFYWNPAKWEIATMEKNGERLPGDEELKYRRIPTLLVFLLGPVLGAAYVMFLPLIGFGLFFGFLAKKTVLAVARAGRMAVPAKQER